MEPDSNSIEVRDLNNQAEILIRAGKVKEAEAKIKKAIDMDPGFAGSYVSMGNLCMAAKDYKEAKNYYKKAMLIEKRGDLYFAYGNACAMNDDISEAIENYNLAISSGYDSAEMMYFMGMAYDYVNEEDMALRFFDKAVKKDPSNANFIVKKIDTYLRMNELDKALNASENLIRVSPETYDGYHYKTIILLQLKKFDEAVEASKNAAERFPEDVGLMADYARALSQNGRLDDAIVAINSAKEMKYYEASKFQLEFLEAQIYAEKADYDKAVELCNDALSAKDLGEREAEVRFMMLNLCLAKQDFDGAMAESEKIIASGREDMFYYAALYYKPFCLKKLGRLDEAQNSFKEANSIYTMASLQKPAALDIYLYRAMCLKDMEQYDKALEIAEFISTIDDNVAELHVIRAEIYEAEGRKSLADEEKEKAYSIKPVLRPAQATA